MTLGIGSYEPSLVPFSLHGMEPRAAFPMVGSGALTTMAHSGWSRLRQRFPPAQLCLIALSGYAGVDMRDACLAEGFDWYLVKPGKIRELERLLGGDRADSGASQR